MCGIFTEVKVTTAGIGKQQGPEAKSGLDTGPAGQGSECSGCELGDIILFKQNV